MNGFGLAPVYREGSLAIHGLAPEDGVHTFAVNEDGSVDLYVARSGAFDLVESGVKEYRERSIDYAKPAGLFERVAVALRDWKTKRVGK